MITGQKSPFKSSLINPRELINLRGHFAKLREVTDDLAGETQPGTLSPRYHDVRQEWLQLFAPSHSVLHNIDPTTLSTIPIYSPKLAQLLEMSLHVSQQTLAEALKAEREEIVYDTNSHLCTLCLQMVRTWSDVKTMVGGLKELSTALSDTINGLDIFIKTHWSVKELSAM